MKILVLNGSPRPHGNTKGLIEAFADGASSAGHQVVVLDVCKLDIHGCMACEHCHSKGKGQCAQKDGMQEVYEQYGASDMLVVASPIYFGSIPGPLTSVIDRLYALFNPQAAPGTGKARKFASILSSGRPGAHEAAKAILEGSLAAGFGFEVVGMLSAGGEENGSEAKLKEACEFGKSL
jgi:multimeric flavodoxin WrbA